MGRGDRNPTVSGIDLRYVMRWELSYVGHADVDPGWNGVAPPTPGVLRTFFLATEGEAWLEAEDRRIDLVPGHAYYIPAVYPTRRTCPERFCCYYGGFACRDLAGNNLLTEYPYPLDLGTWQPISTLDDIETLDTFSHHLYVRCILLAGLLQHYPGFAKKLDKRKEISQRFHRCLAYIDENLSAELEVQQIAEHQCLSRNAFTRAFKAALGITPRAYLNGELNQKACQLVMHTNLSIREVGSELGFKDEYYFNRFFKKMNGIPPLRYRKSAH